MTPDRAPLWATVPLYSLPARAAIRPGPDVPARVAAMERHRRGAPLDGVRFGTSDEHAAGRESAGPPPGEVDWRGLDEAIARLEAGSRPVDEGGPAADGTARRDG